MIDTAAYPQQTSAARIMYHSKYKFTNLTLRLTAAFIAAATPLAAVSKVQEKPAVAEDTEQTQVLSDEKLVGTGGGINLSGIAREGSAIQTQLSTPPKPSLLRKKPLQAQLYEYDRSPLDNRQPFLFVHGLRGEYWPCFRWGKVARYFLDDPGFKAKFKIYLLRYDTTTPLAVTVPQFRQAISSLYDLSRQRPITIVALSMGGNLVFEGMLNSRTDQAIRYVMTLGTPFHGSPLFCRDWIQYSIYKNLAMPWTRVDHSLAFRLYFHRNPNLLKDLPWDDLDHGIPDVGRFFSLLPLGPSGHLTSEEAANARLADLTEQPFDKKKLVTYGGYLLNPYMRSEPIRLAETTVLAPYTLLTMKVPAHFAREHSVLKMLNCVIGSVVASKPAVESSHTPFVYQLNDGITPVESALFLPHSAFKTKGVCNEAALKTIKELTDVRLARVFRNIDHLTFIDGFRPPRTSQFLKDELSPESGSKTIFAWMLSDLLANTGSLTVATENVTEVANQQAAELPPSLPTSAPPLPEPQTSKLPAFGEETATAHKE